MHGDIGDPVGDRDARARKEGCPHPPGPGAQAQIEAGGLDLIGGQGRVRRDRAGGDQGLKSLTGEDAGGVGHERRD